MHPGENGNINDHLQKAKTDALEDHARQAILNESLVRKSFMQFRVKVEEDLKKLETLQKENKILKKDLDKLNKLHKENLGKVAHLQHTIDTQPKTVYQFIKGKLHEK